MHRTACGGTIIIPSSALEHLLAHPEVHELLPEAINQITLPKNSARLAIEVKMGRVVGRSGCVATSPITSTTPTTFALRKARFKASRVVVGIAGREVENVVVIALPTEVSKRYRLLTAFVGDLAPKEPWDQTIRNRNEFEDSLNFWMRHALVYMPDVMGQPFESTWQDVLGR